MTGVTCALPIYIGEWKDGKLNGQGTLTYTDGTVEKGVWEDGNIVEPQ